MNARRHEVLIVGVGSIGERHLRCFLAKGRANVGIVEIDDIRSRSTYSKIFI